MTKLTFTKNGQTASWNDHDLFPTEVYNESEVRSDMQLFHDETKTAFNNLIDDLASTTDSSSGADQIGATALSGRSATKVQGQLEELNTDIATLNTAKHTHSNKSVLDTITSVQDVLSPVSGAVPSSIAVNNAISSGGYIPAGLICMWSGASSAIPNGWYLCDGTNNTPDLRDRFIIGAGSTYAVGTTGGEATHTLTVNEIPAHTHNVGETVTCYVELGPYYSFPRTNVGTENVTGAAGGGAAHNNIPPYYALCFIMKG